MPRQVAIWARCRDVEKQNHHHEAMKFKWMITNQRGYINIYLINRCGLQSCLVLSPKKDSQKDRQRRNASRQLFRRRHHLWRVLSSLVATKRGRFPRALPKTNPNVVHRHSQFFGGFRWFFFETIQKPNSCSLRKPVKSGKNQAFSAFSWIGFCFCSVGQLVNVFWDSRLRLQRTGPWSLVHSWSFHGLQFSLAATHLESAIGCQCYPGVLDSRHYMNHLNTFCLETRKIHAVFAVTPLGRLVDCQPSYESMRVQGYMILAKFPEHWANWQGQTQVQIRVSRKPLERAYHHSWLLEASLSSYLLIHKGVVWESSRIQACESSQTNVATSRHEHQKNVWASASIEQSEAIGESKQLLPPPLIPPCDAPRSLSAVQLFAASRREGVQNGPSWAVGFIFNGPLCKKREFMM